MGLKGVLFQNTPMCFKKTYHKIKINYKKLKNKFFKKNIEKAFMFEQNKNLYPIKIRLKSNKKEFYNFL